MGLAILNQKVKKSFHKTIFFCERKQKVTFKLLITSKTIFFSKSAIDSFTKKKFFVIVDC